MQRMIDPDRDLRRASAEVEISGNVDARRRLAEELLDRSQYEAAIDVYEGGLKGVFEHDPTLLLGLARAQFAKDDFAAARAALERLMQQQSRTSNRRTRICCTPALSMLWARSRRPNTNMQRLHPATPARKRGFATPCC